MKEISGNVSKILFKSDTSGFSIFKFHIDNELPFCDTIVAKGTVFKIQESDYLKLYGEYINDPKYGREFQIDHYESCLPDNLDTLEMYLSKGLIKGIGKVRAHAIISHFQEDTMRVLEEEPERLTEIPGIGKRTAQLIGRRMAERTYMQRTMFQLSKMGIGQSVAQKIYKKYKDKALNILQNNPYQLVNDLIGVGFTTADKIAINNGVSLDSPFRICSGILYTLDNLCTFGNVYYPRDLLLNESEKILKVPKDVIEVQLNAMIQKNQLKLEDENSIYLIKNHISETSVARDIKRIIYSEKKHKLSKKVLNELKKESILDDVQVSAVEIAAKNNMMVLTGGPGVGKTTTTNLIIQYFKKNKKEVVLAAPTGRAAKRMMETTKEESKTIHRLLEVTKGEGKGCQFSRNRENPLVGDVFIIDEVSMMDIYIAEALFQAIPTGKQIILVGDQNQLPSVGAGNVLADIIDSGICPVIELKKVYRQTEGSHIIENAHHVLHGEALNLSNKSNDFYFKNYDDPNELKKALIHYTVDSLPNFTGEREIQVLTPLRQRSFGSNELNLALQNAINPLKDNEEDFKGFRVNDKVMQIANDYERKRVHKDEPDLEEKGVFNGDLGIITKIDFENEYIYVLFDNLWIAQYDFEDIDQLELAYAITIHKSQGSEYPVVVIPIFDYIPMITTMNLIYTGITRAKKAILLIGSKKKLYQMIHNKYSKKRYTRLNQKLKNELIKSL